jgi:hypothetical protein
MNPSQVLSSIVSVINESRISTPFNKNLEINSYAKGENEFLFFIKPEITLDDNNIQLESILTFILDKLSGFNFEIKNIRVINAAYLEIHNIISQHYGVINKLSSDVKSNISSEAIDNFESLYNEQFKNTNVLGSIEFLEKFDYFSPTALSVLWQNSSTEKLAGGTYSQKLTIDGTTTYLVNGFHPRQLEHFISPERTIVVMTLKSNTSWSDARNKLIGKTNPQDALQGSIRKELLERKNEFGLKEISSSWNGVHLSAGAVEGLVELMRYNSDYETNHISNISDYQFGRYLVKFFGKEKAAWLLTNPNMNYKGKEMSVFDLTEELNTEDCLLLLRDII